MDDDDLTGAIIGAAMKVHSIVGPGLLESAYEPCLLYELHKQGLKAESQVPLPVTYGTVTIDAGYRLDLLVEGRVIVELKAAEKLMPIHQAQLLSYLRLGGKRVGLLINFHVVHLRNGIKRIRNDPTG